MKFNKMIYIGYNEEWKPIYIKGEKTKYKISNLGNIRNSKKKKKKILKTILDRYGYEQVCLFHNKKRYVLTVHRLVALAFIENPDNLPHVNHIDGIKKHNSVENLEWVTVSENISHAYKNGLHDNSARGSKHGMNKYSEDQIRHVCRLLEENVKSYKEISKITNVKNQTITDIRTRRYWTHISKFYNIDNYHVSLYRKIDPALKEKIIELAKQQKSTSEMRKILNIPYNDSINSLMHRCLKLYK